MTLSPTDSSSFNLAQTLRSTSAVPAKQSADFQSLLKDKLAATDPHSPEAIRKVAGDLVSQALILPILKQIRRGTFGKNSPLSPGTGEKTFGPEFDIQIADRIAHSPRMAPTNAIAARLQRRVSSETQNAGVDVDG